MSEAVVAQAPLSPKAAAFAATLEGRNPEGGRIALRGEGASASVRLALDSKTNLSAHARISEGGGWTARALHERFLALSLRIEGGEMSLVLSGFAAGFFKDAASSRLGPMLRLHAVALESAARSLDESSPRPE